MRTVSIRTRADGMALARLCLVVLAVVLVPLWPLHSQDPDPSLEPPTRIGGELSAELIKSRIAAAETNQDLDPAVRTKLVDASTKTLELLNAAREASARAEQSLTLARKAPELVEAIKAELAKPPVELGSIAPSDATLGQLQQLLSQAEATLVEAEAALQSLQEEPKRRADRRVEIPKLLDAAKAQLAELQKQMDAKPGADEPAELSAATRSLLEARSRGVAAEAAALQAESQAYETTGELISAQRDRAARRVADAQASVKSLRALVNDRRRQETEDQAIAARKASAQAHPAIRQLAETNAELVATRQSLTDKIEASSRELEETDEQVNSLGDKYDRITTRYDTAGGTESVGLLLRKERAELPDIGGLERQIKLRAQEISDVYLKLIDLEEHRNDLATLGRRVEDIVRETNASPKGREGSFLEDEIRVVLESQRALYDSLIADTNSYFVKLNDLDVHQRQLIDLTSKYASYCDERILWIRSTTPLSLAHLGRLGDDILWLIAPAGWRSVGEAIRDDILRHPVIAFMTLGLVGLLVALQRPLRRATFQLGEQAERSNVTSYIPTWRAFASTGLLAILWPGAIAYLGVRLAASDGVTSEFVHAVGNGLLVVAVLYGTCELLRQVCRRKGLGESHFAWDKDMIPLVRSAVRWFMVTGFPFVFIVAITESQASEAIKNSMGRLAFVLVLLMMGVGIHRVMRPVGGVLERFYASTPQGWLTRMRYGVYYAAIGVPLAFALMAVAGYYYTAVQLAWKLLATWWVGVGLWIVYSALLRWSLLSYRDLAMRKARERRAQADAPQAVAGGVSPAAAAIKAQPELKLADINKQTRKALQWGLGVGLCASVWFLWVDVLPALAILNHVELWSVEVPVVGGTGQETGVRAVTLANLLLAIVIAALTCAASRNVPSLLEIAVLQRLPLEPGVRNAITSVSQYAITAMGLIGAFGIVGIGWSKVQWLVAAISVGLGFGLQEIFANFVSGLVLLFERPVRLGDIVTVGDVTGHVTRIQMRATTIMDWDMRELVVPNKEFITGRVMNWTLSSTVSRMSIVVGVAYGTNPDVVRNILLDIAARHPLVLKDPPPHALFDVFADSTQNFVLRVYMASRNVYLELRHELMTNIAREFADAGVEIAFPQRELHFRNDVASEAHGMNGHSPQRTVKLVTPFSA